MYSYENRLKAMRDTKIRHTLEKKKQNGYTDLDDFGTVPISEGYCVEPWYNSTNGSFYGYDGMCENFVRVINAHVPYIDPMEMLCGRWRDMLVNYRGDLHYMPDWLKNNLKNLEFIKNGATNQWSKRWDEQHFPYDDLKPWQEKYNITTGIDGDAHFACDYSIGFELGFGGFLDKIEKYRRINPDKQDFYDAEERCVKAIIDFIGRHIDALATMIEKEENAQVRDNLKEMQKTCEAIQYNPPKTFREACQWTAFFNCAARIYTRDGAGFQLDGLLYPYYERDVKAGILDGETAKFLIANLLLIDPHYYQISGVDENDKDMTNHLSYLILDAPTAVISNWSRINMKTGRIERLTDDVLKMYDSEPEHTNFENEWIGKIKECELYNVEKEFYIDRNFIDANNHMNNVYYLDLANLILPDEVYENFAIDEFEIVYRKAVMYAQTVKCFYGETDDAYIVTVKSQDMSDLHAIMRICK